MRGGQGKGLIILLLVVMVGIASTVYILYILSPERQAEKAVDSFYTFEQDGAFSSSWAMFHPFMQEKFDKAHYIQDRAHVFMNHLGVTTFSFTIDDTQEIRNWKIDKDREAIDIVYNVTVAQHYQGKYGNFTLVQNVYATKLEGEWRLLWDYKK
ncbi:hypothetical protein ACFQ3N_03940 [Virgibacillus byunsanensis]|uniref:DUF4878 domain-containing protein n=1 Tax=Virgibacillus byunsanensis TaxID=570945 RepID=A0ABW3LGT6_9BACI